MITKLASRDERARAHGWAETLAEDLDKVVDRLKYKSDWVSRTLCDHLYHHSDRWLIVAGYIDDETRLTEAEFLAVREAAVRSRHDIADALDRIGCADGFALWKIRRGS